VEVKSVLTATEESLKEINARRKEAVDIVFSMHQLSPPGEQALMAAKEEQPDKFRLGSKLKLWANGAVIRVRFLGGDADEQERVKAIALEWTKHANLTFAFGTSAEAEVRISFDPNGGSWSYQGTDALGISKDQPTMNLGWVTTGNTLHEFGHVLGLIEEHCNPSARIRWNKTAVYEALEGPPNLWTKEQIDRVVFCKGVVSDIGAYREFDPTSIMTNTFPGKYTEGLVLGGSEALSDSDKALAARLYPKEG
jgi:hypothetical protein